MSKCRICFCSKPRKYISELHYYGKGKKQTFEDIIMFCLGIQITEDSNKSTKLCVKCYRLIIKFYEFKVLALKNDHRLRSSVLQNDVVVKEDKENMEKEETAENNDTYFDEPIVVQVKNEDDFDFGAQNNEDDNVTELKYEFKEENYSDDEFLSVIQNSKSQPVEEVRVNAPAQKKKSTKAKIQKVFPRDKKKKIYEGICEHCGKIYKDITAHMRLHHKQGERKRINCEHCDKTFANNVYKRRHVQRRHLNVRQACPVCDRSVANLKMHMRNMHEKDSLPFKCVHCDLKFLTQSRLKIHTTKHTENRPFQCDICDRTFRLKMSLTDHIRQVHNKEKNYVCQICSKSYFRKIDLATHLRSHTNEKPYPCLECGNFYRSSKSLNVHRLIHKSEKTISCNLCEATFINKSYLSSHMMSHTKEKRYPCQYCKVRFHRSDHRKRHEYTAHLKHAGDVADVPRSYTPRKRSAAPRNKPLEDACEGSTGTVSSAPSV